MTLAPADNFTLALPARPCDSRQITSYRVVGAGLAKSSVGTLGGAPEVKCDSLSRWGAAGATRLAGDAPGNTLKSCGGAAHREDALSDKPKIIKKCFINQNLNRHAASPIQ